MLQRRVLKRKTRSLNLKKLLIDLQPGILQRMEYLKRIILLIIVFALAGLALSCSKRNEPDSLSGAVLKVVQYKTAQNYRDLWTASSARFQSSNDNDEAAYEKYARSYGIHPDNVEVLSIEELASEAKVKVRTHYILANGATAGSAIEEWRFVREKSRWVLDGYRTISESEK
jgi:hypothetical protein